MDWGKPRQWDDKSARPLRVLKAVLKNCFCFCACGVKGRPLWKNLFTIQRSKIEEILMRFS